MKRRKKQKRDWEAETLKKLTTLSISEQDMRLRLLADKASLELKLKEVFAYRRFVIAGDDSMSELQCNELIRGISSELRAVKVSLQ